jgi:surface protein
MKSYKLWQILASLLLLCLFQSCDKDDDTPAPIEITFNGITFTIPENPTNEQVIGELPASVNRGDLAFSLKDQDPTGAMAINPTSGQLTVLDASKFDFETNPSITATAVATVEGVEKTATITVTITDVVELGPGFVTTWETTVANESIEIPTVKGTFTYDYAVDWGDGTTSTNLITDATHTYASAGTYTVQITGVFPAIQFYNTGNNTAKIKSIEQWGNVAWESMFRSFEECSALAYNATDTPDLSGVETLSNMFAKSNFNGNISSWDVSNIKSMNYLFFRNSSFNQPLNDWDVSNVTSMVSMFSEASVFNQPLSNWSMSNVTTVNNMFSRATNFNQPIANWDVSKVTNMANLFLIATSFNQPIGNWNTSSLTSMGSMFYDAKAFNQDLNSWDVSKVTSMSQVFFGAIAFDSNISSWNVSKVSNMANMFRLANKFNQDIGNWNVQSVTNVTRMFQEARAFNQDISNWDVSNATNMSYMFQNASAFNQNVSGWDIGKATNLFLMFSFATDFSQNLGGWDISNVTNIQSMISQSGLSITNYDLTLDGWSKLATVPTGLSFTANGMEYCKKGKDARTFLIDTKNWIISGDVDVIMTCQ